MIAGREQSERAGAVVERHLVAARRRVRGGVLPVEVRGDVVVALREHRGVGIDRPEGRDAVQGGVLEVHEHAVDLRALQLLVRASVAAGEVRVARGVRARETEGQIVVETTDGRGERAHGDRGRRRGRRRRGGGGRRGSRRRIAGVRAAHIGDRVVEEIAVDVRAVGAVDQLADAALDLLVEAAAEEGAGLPSALAGERAGGHARRVAGFDDRGVQGRRGPSRSCPSCRCRSSSDPPR